MPHVVAHEPSPSPMSRPAPIVWLEFTNQQFDTSNFAGTHRASFAALDTIESVRNRLT